MLERLAQNALVELSVTYRSARGPGACGVLAAAARLGLGDRAMEWLVRYGAVGPRMYMSLLLLYFYVPDCRCVGP